MKRAPFLLLLVLATLAMALALLATAADAQGPKSGVPTCVTGALGSGFSYQGQLKQGSNPVNGTCSISFGLWDAETGGSQVGVTLTQSIAVANGLFTSQPLDFGAGAFDGSARYLQIAAKCGSDSAYTPLSPRQPVTAAPYALFAKRFAGYQNIKVVAKSGGDYASIAQALANILDAGPENPYLVYVAPGVYTETVTMKSYVDIEGAGEQLTKIASAGSWGDFAATVIGANNAELRFLTVENTGNSNLAKAILNNGTSPRLNHITAIARNGNSYSFGIQNYMAASPTLTHVTARASGPAINRAVYNDQASPTLNDVTATGEGGTHNFGIYSSLSAMTGTNVTAIGLPATTLSVGLRTDSASVLLENSVLRGAHYGFYNSGSTSLRKLNVNNSHIVGPTNAVVNDGNSIPRIGGSQLEGGGVNGPVTCIGVWDENYASLGYSNCP